MSIATSTLSRNRLQPVGLTWAGVVAAILLLLNLAGVLGPEAWIVADLVALAASGVAAAWLGYRAWKLSADQLGPVFEIQLSMSLLVFAFVMTRQLGTLGVETYASIYLLLALLVTFQSRRGAAAAVACALILEWSPWLNQQGLEPDTYLSHSAFIVAFGLFSLIVHGAELLERRKHYRREVEQERENLLRQAREFRLLSSGRSDAPTSRLEAEELITRDAVDAVNHSIYVTLSLLKIGLKCHTCILLWFDVRSDRLRIKELVSDSDSIIEGQLDPARGVIGGITRRREPVNLENLRPGFRGLSYYREAPDVTSFLGVPVIENGHLRGVLCVDRTDGRPFEQGAVDLVREAAGYIVRAVENERLFATIEKSKYELSRFFDASRRLNGVLTPGQVYDVALACAQEIAPYDFAAITVYDEETQRHRVVALDTSETYDCDAEAWRDLEFSSNNGLVSMVVKNCHYLPYGGNLRDARAMLFTSEQTLEGLSSMLVLPLIAQDQTIGTFVVGHRDAHQYPTERREMLEVVGNQVAVTLQNARLYEQMEQMATTDGLTGLANHRTFQAKLEEAMARHRRAKRSFCLLLTDIDHFKSVNDTHGHPVGDEVLRQTAKLFHDNLRETDVPCRYGGEEFAIILEDTDVEGARVIADRIRTELKKLVFHSDHGPFSCSISIGVGHWPQDASDKQTLIDYTDQALYHSKENGRDRVTAYEEIARAAS